MRFLGKKGTKCGQCHVKSGLIKKLTEDYQTLALRNESLTEQNQSLKKELSDERSMHIESLLSALLSVEQARESERIAVEDRKRIEAHCANLKIQLTSTQREAHIPDERQRKQHLDEWAGFFATSSSLAVSLYVPRHIEAFRLPESLRSKARAVAKQYKDITWDAFNTKMVRETWLNLVDIAVAFNLAPTHFSGTPFAQLVEFYRVFPGRCDLLKEQMSKLEFFLLCHATTEEDEGHLGLTLHADGSHPIVLKVFKNMHQSAQHAFTTVLHEFGHPVQDVIFDVDPGKGRADDGILTDVLRDKGVTQEQLNDHGQFFCAVMWKIHLLVGCFLEEGFLDLHLHDDLLGIRPTVEYLKRFQ